MNRHQASLTLLGPVCTVGVKPPGEVRCPGIKCSSMPALPTYGSGARTDGSVSAADMTPSVHHVTEPGIGYRD